MTVVVREKTLQDGTAIDVHLSAVIFTNNRVRWMATVPRLPDLVGVLGDSAEEAFSLAGSLVEHLTARIVR